MFYLIGIGLKPEHLSLEATGKIKECKKVFLESYTSFYSEGSVKELKELTGREIIPLARQEVEEKSKELVAGAKKEDTALLVFGNPLTATTHQALLLEMKENGVQFEVIPGISVKNFLGFSGLNEYKFGRTVTIVFPSENFSPKSFYGQIGENQRIGLHSLCLLDIRKEEKRFMSITEGIEVLERIEREEKKSVLRESILVGVSGAGSGRMKIKAGSAGGLKKERFEGFPQSLVVCGELDENEKSFLKEFSEWNGK